MANTTWLFDAPFLTEAQQRTFLKLRGKESILWTKEIVEEAFSVLREWCLYCSWDGMEHKDQTFDDVKGYVWSAITVTMMTECMLKLPLQE